MVPVCSLSEKIQGLACKKQLKFEYFWVKKFKIEKLSINHYLRLYTARNINEELVSRNLRKNQQIPATLNFLGSRLLDSKTWCKHRKRKHTTLKKCKM